MIQIDSQPPGGGCCWTRQGNVNLSLPSQYFIRTHLTQVCAAIALELEFKYSKRFRVIAYRDDLPKTAVGAILVDLDSLTAKALV